MALMEMLSRKMGAFIACFLLIFAVFCPCFPTSVLYAQETEFGVADDFTALGTNGTADDPDTEIKGFSVFGSTQVSYTGAVTGPGNVVVNGYLAVSSGAYFVGNSTFTGASKIFINDGTTGQLLRKNSGGYLYWDNISALGDNLGNHVATTTLDMGGQSIVNASSGTFAAGITASSFTAANTAGAGLMVSSSAYLAVSGGNVGIGTTSPGAKLHVGTYGTITAPAYNINNGDGLLFDFFNIGSPYTRSGNIVASAADTSEARLSFYTKALSANPTEKVTIFGNGNVGIGTTGPAATLHVLGPTTGTNLPVAIFDKNYGQPGDPSTALRMTLNAGAGGGYFFGYNGEAAFAHNAEYISGTGWVARQTTASLLDQTAGNIFLYGNTGLTIGNVFTPAIRLAVLASGNVGVGTASPTSGKLQVEGGSADNATGIYGYTNSNGGSSISGVQDNSGGKAIYGRSGSGWAGYFDGKTYFNGNVGIGTTAPVSQLQLTNAIASPGLGEAAGFGQLRLENGATALSGAGGIEFKIAGDTNGYGSKIQALNSSGSQLAFAGRQGSATWSEYMRIAAGGNVGIGTTSPGAKLEVQSAVSAAPITNGILRIVGTGTNPATGSGGGLSFWQEASNAVNYQYASITGRRIDNAANNMIDLDFNTGAPVDGTTLATRMTITNSGNIGIGTTNPAAKLQIVGTFANSGAYTSTYHIDTSPAGVVVASGGTIDIPNFSGMVIVNNWSNGNITTFLCGGGSTTAIGSVGGTVGTMTYVSGIAGYRWTSNYGSSAIYGLVIIRTRPTA